MPTPIAPFISAVRSSVLGGGGAATPYSDILVDYGAFEVWIPSSMVDATIPAKITPDRDGSATGWDIQNSPGVITNTLVPYIDGANDVSTLLSASLISNFNGHIGSVFIWGKDNNPGDTSLRYLWRSAVNTSNEVTLAKLGGEHVFVYISGGVAKFDGVSPSSDFFSMGMSWKDGDNGDEVRCFYNGSYVFSFTGLGVWSGVLGASRIGVVGTSPGNVWNGWVDYPAIRFDSVWSDDDFSAIHAAAASAGAG